MITLQNISKVFKTDAIETWALENISLTIDKGEFISIMGPSGCGKSTLLSIMGLLDLPSEGTISINGNNPLTLKDKQLAKFRNEHLGFVFQSFHLINDLSVRDNVAMPLLYRKVSSKETKQRVEAALEKVGLTHRMDHKPSQLSGGQRQRVAIARAIVGNPSIIFADEPTGNLDSVMGDEVMQMLLKLNEEGATIIMVTHDEQQAKLTDRIIRVFDGRQVSVQPQNKLETV
ncbi:ABC transporter ATP-binding protein [Flammeovirga kamogawensis]|uniref:ABC transporter ATP-binding protein n=1 Tax=Flammeovirga kamogawensis TaxID=373891 RepID=A0ABX8H392_9BACT|nr:ABC transporter ATP-binding protein [Flammeovirga kamogawensis]MBB6460484.1 putative ABC transport system ATP-binding protein [Flammeovirga kamogawensis]QWG10290.1 ABC transporter ATP-binding protein [Flammeovirga kamogawensis]TRX64738.1 ABC transporter ATP-binding protein [Flammeovirga kamogawensis]